MCNTERYTSFPLSFVGPTPKPLGHCAQKAYNQLGDIGHDRKLLFTPMTFWGLTIDVIPILSLFVYVSS